MYFLEKPGTSVEASLYILFMKATKRRNKLIFPWDDKHWYNCVEPRSWLYKSARVRNGVLMHQSKENVTLSFNFMIYAVSVYGSTIFIDEITNQAAISQCSYFWNENKMLYEIAWSLLLYQICLGIHLLWYTKNNSILSLFISMRLKIFKITVETIKVSFLA